MAKPNFFDGMSDDEVLARSGAALQEAIAAPAGSMDRLTAFAAFDLSQAELAARAMGYALEKIRNGEHGFDD